MRKPSCLISCSHWLPDGSLSVLVGRHGAMNPAGRVRCNMGTKYGWLTTIATFTGSKPAFCYPRLGHDALRLRRGKPRPAGKNKPSAGRGAYAIRALPEEKPRLPKKTGPEADSVRPLKSPVSPQLP